MSSSTRYCFIKNGNCISNWFYKIPIKQGEAIARKNCQITVALWRFLKKQNKIVIRKQELVNGGWSEIK